MYLYKTTYILLSLKCQKLTHLYALDNQEDEGLKIYLGGEWGLRREVQKFGLGENGACFPSGPAFERPLHLPIGRNRVEKFLTVHPMMERWERTNAGLMKCLHRLMEPCRHGIVTIGQFSSGIQSLDIFCQTARQKRRDVTY